MRGRQLFFLALVGLCALLIPAIPAAAQDTTGRVCVTAFHDANQNRMRDSIEPLLADVVVNLQDAQAVVIAAYLTDGRSEPHCFTGVAPGTYTVTFDSSTSTPTGQTSFGAIVIAGQTVQANFGAIPAAVTTTAPTAPASAGDDNTTLRLALSCVGAGFVMLLMLGFGVILYWMRYR